MDTTQPSSFSSPYARSPSDLGVQLHSSDAPLVIDVRKNEAYLASEFTLPGALRRDPFQVAEWGKTLPEGAAVLVYCVHGHEVGMDTMNALRQHGVKAEFLQGGIESWRAQGFPVVVKNAGTSTRWVTRERPKIDRIACPWLIRRFVDEQAQFLYVPTGQVREVAQVQQATPYDVHAQVADTQFTHEGEQCSFDAFIRHYRLGGDEALVRLAEIVRAADIDRLEVAPQAAGLLAVSLGMSCLQTDDHAMLEAMMPVYDALYAWCRELAAGQDEKHNWKPLGSAA